MASILLSPKRAEKHPVEMGILGFLYTSLAIALSAWIFPDYASLVMVFLTVLPCVYIVQGVLRREESKEKDYLCEEWLLKEHSKCLIFLLFLFLGFVFAFAFWTLVLPHETVSLIFELQNSVVQGIREMVATGNATSNEAFWIIILNNFKVLFISLVFAFFYGAGAIFILVWNASVMGFVIGDLARQTLGFAALPIAFTKYFLHGIPEMLAYLIVSLAGGIAYIAAWKGHFLKKGRLKRLILDSIVLVLISAALLFIAAAIEIFISPLV